MELDSNPTIKQVIFKSLILIHYLLKKGDSENLIKVLISDNGIFPSNREFRNTVNTTVILSYSSYLKKRAVMSRSGKYDWIRMAGVERKNLFSTTLDTNTLLDHTNVIQALLQEALSCNVRKRTRLTLSTASANDTI